MSRPDTPLELPYGSWPSPLTATTIVAGSVRLSRIRSAGSVLFWDETFPGDPIRCTVMRWENGTVIDALPSYEDVRTTVHEYGGGGWWLDGEAIIFANNDDSAVRRREPDVLPSQVLTEPGGHRAPRRYCDGVVVGDGRWSVCVREDHRGEGEPRNELVALRRDGYPEVVLVSGPDFVSSPRIDFSGTRLAWLQWNHPDMPWDGTELWVGRLDCSGTTPALVETRRVAGGRDESVFQPQWSPANRLHYVSDRSDWWNLRRFVRPGLPEAGEEAESLHDQPLEIGQPQWVFDQCRYAFVDGSAGSGDVESIVFAATADGRDRLWYLTGRGESREIAVPHTAISSVEAHQDGVAYIGAGWLTEPEIVFCRVAEFDANEPGVEVIRPAPPLELDSGWFSTPESLSFSTGDGSETAYGLYFPPTNPLAVGCEGELPPLLVSIHGGPTASARSHLQLSVQYWTSRGFAVVDVNYRGSTGYGRPFRHKLDRAWGVADVEDCTAAAVYLAERGLVDPDRMAIHGTSAGGFTTLCAMAHSKVFAAGTSAYGVTDLEALALETHKFESRYLDRLIGPYPAERATYLDRSPLQQVEALDRPLLILQGADDKIVPPNQAERIVEALDERGVPVAYLLFENEAHGFRGFGAMIRALEAEFFFYAEVLGFDPVDQIEAVAIRNNH